MLCYGDKTYCLGGEHCANADKCGRALTGEVVKAAQGLDMAISVIDKCEDFKVREDTEDGN